MKKFFSFAIALVASALAFTSCENEAKIDSPLVGGWNTRGELTLIDESTGESKTYDADHSFTFFDNGQWQYNIYIHDTFNGVYKRGTWSVKENKLTLRTQISGTISNNNFTPKSGFQPTEEVVTWYIEDHYLFLTYSNGDILRLYDGSGK